MKTRIFEQAKAIGFDTVGFTTAENLPAHREGLLEFLQAGHHGTMQWMQDRAELRASPNALWPEAKSVIVLGHNYAPEANPLEKLAHKTNGNISSYALNQDYHDVIKKKLKQLARMIAEEFKCEVKVFVDTAPVMEKPLAEAAGLGWQGKHTCLVSREFGNWLFLGSIFTTLDLDTPSLTLPPQGGGDLCGTCRACLDICPTQAFTAERKLDARKCISYLTIEHKGSIPIEYRKAMGNRIYGCDDCLAICPWNKFAKVAQETAYHAREELKAPALKDLVQLDDAGFRALFTKSPIKRIGRDRFIRNVLIAIGNSEDASLKASAAALIHDDSELVREAALWAVDELEKRPI